MEIYIAAFCCILITFMLYMLIEKKVKKGEKLLFYFLIGTLLFVISMSSPN